MLKNKAYPVFLIIAGICFTLTLNFTIGIILTLFVIGLLYFSKIVEKKLILSLLIIFVLGTTYRFNYYKKLSKIVNKPVNFSGVIINITNKKHYTKGKILTLNITKYDNTSLSFFKIYEFTIPNKLDKSLRGMKIKGNGLIKEKTVFKNKNIDKTNFYKARNSLYYISIPSTQNIVIEKSFFNYIFSTIDKIKLYQSETNTAVLKAILTGDKNQIPYQLMKSLRNSGIYHLFVVSGFHFGIFFSFIYFILMLIPIRKKYKKLTSLLILLILLIINAFAPSTVRAFSMLFIYFLFNSLDIEISPLDSVGIAGLIMLTYNIYQPNDPGFLLSFLVTGGILSSLNEKEKILPATIKITAVAFLTSTPIIVFLFHKINILSPILNLIATPIVFASIYSYLLSIIHLPFTEQITNILIYLLITITKIGEQYSVPLYISYSTGILSLITVGIYTSTKITLKKTTFYIIFISLIILISQNFKTKSSFLIVPDTGQSQCIILKTDKQVTVIDTATEHGTISGLIPILKDNRITIIDNLFISHFDSDHGGGLGRLLQEIKVKTVYFPYFDSNSSNFCKGYSFIKQHKIKLIKAKKGDLIKINNKTTIKILNPKTNTKQHSTNASSMALEITTHNKKITIPGDLDGKDLLKIAQNFSKTDILIAPHHGSKKAAIKSFAQQTNPNTVIVCAGKYNRFNFPTKKFLNLYKNSKIWITGKDGEFIIELE